MQCMRCLGPMEPVEVERWIWALGRNFAALREHHDRQPARPALRDFLDDMLPRSGSTWALTRPGDAGLPLEGLPGQPLHTWFMGLAGYRATLEEFLHAHPERGTLDAWWHRETRMVHFLGLDCAYSHALGYAALQTLDDEGPPPGMFVTNRFLKLDGKDFSTSRGHAVWIREITGQHPTDAVRLFTALHAPENDEADFDRVAFESWRVEVFDRLIAAMTADLAVRDSTECEDAPDAVLSVEADAIVSDWHRAADLAQFSIAGMARSVLALADRIPALKGRGSRQAHWRLFRDLAAPLCPGIAGEIDALLRAASPGTGLGERAALAAAGTARRTLDEVGA